MTPVRLKPTAPQSRVKHSTTEPLGCHFNSLGDSVNLDNQASDEAVDQSHTVFHQNDRGSAVAQ